MSEIYYWIQRWDEKREVWTLQAGADTLDGAMENLKWYRKGGNYRYRLVVEINQKIVLEDG
jgi:hypothetical protein